MKILKKILIVLIHVFGIVGAFMAPDPDIVGYGPTILYTAAYIAAVIFVLLYQRKAEAEEVKELRKEGYRV